MADEPKQEKKRTSRKRPRTRETLVTPLTTERLLNRLLTSPPPRQAPTGRETRSQKPGRPANLLFRLPTFRQEGAGFFLRTFVILFPGHSDRLLENHRRLLRPSRFLLGFAKQEGGNHPVRLGRETVFEFIHAFRQVAFLKESLCQAEAEKMILGVPLQFLAKKSASLTHAGYPGRLSELKANGRRVVGPAILVGKVDEGLHQGIRIHGREHFFYLGRFDHIGNAVRAKQENVPGNKDSLP